MYFKQKKKTLTELQSKSAQIHSDVAKAQTKLDEELAKKKKKQNIEPLKLALDKAKASLAEYEKKLASSQAFFYKADMNFQNFQQKNAEMAKMYNQVIKNEPIFQPALLKMQNREKQLRLKIETANSLRTPVETIVDHLKNAEKHWKDCQVVLKKMQELSRKGNNKNLDYNEAGFLAYSGSVDYLKAVEGITSELDANKPELTRMLRGESGSIEKRQQVFGKLPRYNTAEWFNCCNIGESMIKKPDGRVMLPKFETIVDHMTSSMTHLYNVLCIVLNKLKEEIADLEIEWSEAKVDYNTNLKLIFELAKWLAYNPGKNPPASLYPFTYDHAVSSYLKQQHNVGILGSIGGSIGGIGNYFTPKPNAI